MISTPQTSKLKFIIQNNSEENKSKESYNFIVLNNEENLTFTLESLEDFPAKIYEFKIDFKKLKEKDDNFSIFTNAERFMGGIKKCIESNNYKVGYNKEESNVVF